MLYSPLTLIIGRQELNYGTSLIVGRASLYHNPNNIAYRDLSSLHGFDAIRAILDYDPWTMDLVIAKMEESDDDAIVGTPSQRCQYVKPTEIPPTIVPGCAFSYLVTIMTAEV